MKGEDERCAGRCKDKGKTGDAARYNAKVCYLPSACSSHPILSTSDPLSHPAHTLTPPSQNPAQIQAQQDDSNPDVHQAVEGLKRARQANFPPSIMPLLAQVSLRPPRSTPATSSRSAPRASSIARSRSAPHSPTSNFRRGFGRKDAAHSWRGAARSSSCADRQYDQHNHRESEVPALFSFHRLLVHASDHTLTILLNRW